MTGGDSERADAQEENGNGSVQAGGNGDVDGGLDRVRAAAAATTSTSTTPLTAATDASRRRQQQQQQRSSCLATTGAASKLWYLWTYAAQAMLVPFLNLAFLREAGLTRAQLGVVSAARPWLSAVAGNLWALWADATGRHGPILIFAYCACGLLRYSLRFVKGFPQTLAVVLFMEALGSPVNIIADAAVIASGSSEGDYGRTRLFGAVGWGLFSPVGGWLVQRRGLAAGFVANGVGWGTGLLLTLMLPVSVLSNSSSSSDPSRKVSRASEISPSEEAAQEEGERRRGDGEGRRGEGSPSSSSSSPSSSDDEAAAAAVAEAAAREAPLAPAAELVAFDGHALAHHHQQEQQKKKKKREKKRHRGGRNTADVEEPLLASNVAEEEGEIAGDGNAANADPAAAAAAAAASNDNESLPLSKKLAAVFSSPRAAAFFATATLFGFAMGTIDCWLFVYLDEALGAKEALMGATLTVTCVVEAPVFYASGALIRTLGVPRILSLVHAAFLLRLACYWALPWIVLGPWKLSPWVVLCIEPLHGITFGCAWAAGCAQAARLAPRGLQATTQALFSGLYLGAGSGLGALVGGVVHSRFSKGDGGEGGGRAIFAVAAGVVAVGWLLSTVAEACFIGPAAAAAASVADAAAADASGEGGGGERLQQGRREQQ